MTQLRGWIVGHLWVSLLGTLLIGSAVGAASTVGSGSEKDEQIEALTDDLEAEQERFAETLAQVEEATTALEATEADLDDVEAEREALADELKQTTAKRPMPNLVGQREADASALEEAYGWSVSIKTQPSDKSPGTILAQQPSPGTQMRFASEVTITIAVPLPPGWKDIKVFSGSGEITTEEVRIPDAKVRLLYSFSGGTNAQLTMYRRPHQYVENFLNEIGEYSASTRVYYSGRFYFEICCGSWTVRLQEFK